MELRNYTQIVLQNGTEQIKFPPSNWAPVFTKEVGNLCEQRSIVVPAGGTTIVPVWTYADKGKVFDFLAMYNASGAGIVDLEYVIGKPTSSTDYTQSGAWTPSKPSIKQLACGAVMQEDSPFVLIPSTAADMNDADDYETAVAAETTATGIIYAIKASNPGTADVILKTLTVWSDE